LRNASRGIDWHERHKEEKKGEEIKDGDGGDEGEDAGKKRKQCTGSMKWKKRYQKEDEDDEDKDKPPKRFPIYIFIEGTRPFAAHAGHSKPAASVPPPLIIQKGPFFHLVTSSFSSLKCNIANHMPCNPDLLAVPSFMWKYDKLANGTWMQLTTEVGYEALIDSVKKKSKTVVFIYMKPPAKDIVSAYII